MANKIRIRDYFTTSALPKGASAKGTGKKTSSMKNFGLNTQARADEYTKRGWKQDATSKVAKPKAKRKVVEVKASSVGAKAVSKTISPKKKSTGAEATPAKKATTKLVATKAAKKAPKITKGTERVANRAAKTRAKKNEALASGNKTKAKRLERREGRLKKRGERKIARNNKK